MAQALAVSGIVYALAAAVCFGISAPCIKALGLGASPLAGAGLLYGGAALAVGAWRLLRRGPSPESPLRRGDVPLLAAIVLVGGLAAPLLLLVGIGRASGATASLLLNLEAPLTALLAVAIFREHLGRAGILGTLVIVAGAAWLGWDPRGGPDDLLGIVAVIGASLAWAIDNNLTARLTLRDPELVIMVKGAGAALCATVLAAATGAALPTGTMVAGGLLVGAVSYGTSLAFYLRAQRLLGAARTGALFALGPFVGALLSLTYFREPPRWAHLGAAVLMLLGVGLFVREHHDHEHSHEELEHEHLHTHDEHHRHEHRGGEGAEPHAHEHHHAPLRHRHGHTPDAHHRHPH